MGLLLGRSILLGRTGIITSPYFYLRGNIFYMII